MVSNGDSPITLLNLTLKESDPELFALIQKEKKRQIHGLEMLGSENFTSLSVLQCLSTCLHNKYSEGFPGARYYGGNEYIDQIELLAQKRALAAFNLNPKEWGVNVQPYAGSPANLAVYVAVVEPHGRIMGLDLPDGGHLTHGYRTATKRVSSSSIFFESMPYKINQETGLIDYDELEKTAKLFKPTLIIAGTSCYSRLLDYKRFKEIADQNGAILFSDMAHIAGLIAAGLIPSPFEYSDIVNTTTHKTLRGPRGGLIFYRKGVKAVNETGEKIFYDYESKINQAVFPGLQGGPHNNNIGGIATALLQAQQPQFVEYQKQIIVNTKRLAEGLLKRGYKIVTGGTDVHLVLVDFRSMGLTGGKVEKILDAVSINGSKSSVPGDKNAFNPSGFRFGIAALTTRGLQEEDIDQVCVFIDEAIQIAKEIQIISGPKLVDYIRLLENDYSILSKVNQLRGKVECFSKEFPLPGYAEY